MGEWEEMESNSQWVQDFFWGRQKWSKIGNGDVCKTLNILKTMELYILNGQIVWYVNYITSC